MSKWGPLNSHSSRASSDLPTHSPLRVPTITIVSGMSPSLLVDGFSAS